jgi:hypothetical protein
MTALEVLGSLIDAITVAFNWILKHIAGVVS